MGNKLAKLIDVKSIVTIILTVVFSILAIRRDVSAEHFLTVYSVIIAFYFGVQYEKHRNKADEKEGDESDGD
jgi:uncharacterized protein (DUF486 family)